MTTSIGVKATLLGSGSSGGVPLAGGDDGAGYWGKCDPANPKNRRTRASILIKANGKRFLVDTSPDLRQQMLDNRIAAVDAIFYTHNHADHIHGIDDVRALNHGKGAILPAYTDAFYVERISSAFPYIFKDPVQGTDFYKPGIRLETITPPEPFVVEGVKIQPFYQDHGFVKSIGFRVGNFAYSTDVKAFPPESEPFLYGLDVWMVAAVQRGKPHGTHAHLELVLEWVERYRPKLTILTHMNNSMDYATLAAELPPHVRPGYDGLMVEC